jgi:hypothetical protein
MPLNFTGGYDPTTPHKPLAKKRAAGASKHPPSKPPPSQARAGPSNTKPASRPAARKASAKTAPVVEVDGGGGGEEEEAEIVHVGRDEHSRSRSTTGNTATSNGTAKGTAKAKGNDKAEVSAKRTASPVIIDESSEDERRQTKNGVAQGKRAARRSPSPEAVTPSVREVERLRKQLQEVRTCALVVPFRAECQI